MTVVARRVKATPARSASDAWQVIVDLLAPMDSAARSELLRVEGVASSMIASQATKAAPIVVYGNGPRVRIYCLFGDDAIEGEQANEERLASCPTEGDWSLSLPAPADDLKWVREALAKRSTRVTARDESEPVEASSEDEGDRKAAAAIDREAFLRP